MVFKTREGTPEFVFGTLIFFVASFFKGHYGRSEMTKLFKMSFEEVKDLLRNLKVSDCQEFPTEVARKHLSQLNQFE